MQNVKTFSPLAFLASLGAGGLAVSFFAFANYTVEHGKGLINFFQAHEILNGGIEYLYYAFDLGMMAFIVLHLVLTASLLKQYIPWLRTGEYKAMLNNPLANAGLMAPFISLTMTMNVLIGPIRYFIPFLASNLQGMMLPGLVAWLALWALTMYMVIKVLTISFTKGFDLDKIHFGWLLIPFSLGMITVTGTGIAAMAQNASIANLAFFVSIISGTMGLFLLAVKMTAVFKSQFNREGLPETQFLPSLLIIVPNVTLYAISAFRLGHYLERQHDVHLHAYFMIVMTVAFAFELWYMMFGLSLLRSYIKKNLLQEFHISQWGMVCPFVAVAVLGSFVHATFISSSILFGFIVATIGITVSLFFFLLTKQLKCQKAKKMQMSIKSANTLVCN